MAYAFGSDTPGFGGSSSSASTITTTQSITVAQHDLIWAWIIVAVQNHTFTVTDNFSNTYAQVQIGNDASGDQTWALFVCRDSNSAGTCTPTTTINSAAAYQSMVIG